MSTIGGNFGNSFGGPQGQGGGTEQIMEMLVVAVALEEAMQSQQGGQNGMGQGNPFGNHYGGHRGHDGHHMSEDLGDEGDYGEGGGDEGNPLEGLLEALGGGDHNRGCGSTGEGGQGHNGWGEPQPQSIKQGQPFTTEDGTKISWNGDKIDVQEPGQQGNSGSFSMSGNGPDGQYSMSGAYDDGKTTAGRNWNVWGDPHIKNPDGSASNFSRSNGLFGLQNGGHLFIGADGANKTANKVTYFPPGSDLSGFDQSQTTDYEDQGGANGGAFKDEGTVASQNVGEWT